MYLTQKQLAAIFWFEQCSPVASLSNLNTCLTKTHCIILNTNLGYKCKLGHYFLETNYFRSFEVFRTFQKINLQALWRARCTWWNGYKYRITKISSFVIICVFMLFDPLVVAGRCLLSTLDETVHKCEEMLMFIVIAHGLRMKSCLFPASSWWANNNKEKICRYVYPYEFDFYLFVRYSAK